jgi:uncharacterized cupredoxin-like copper-binding protein
MKTMACLLLATVLVSGACASAIFSSSLEERPAQSPSTLAGGSSGLGARGASVTGQPTAAVTQKVVTITERDFAIATDAATAPGGLLDFTVANSGPSPHEFLIFQADQDPAHLPLKDGRVDEESDQITKVFDSGDNIAPGTSKTFHAALRPGTYVLVCNLPAHYLAGMHTAFTVGPAATPPAVLPVVERDFAIQTPTPATAAGLVDVTVTNTGPSPHELLIFQADQDPADLPLKDGRVDEESDQITKVFDSGDNITPGTSKTFHAALSPGKYVIVCNLPGHYLAGMRTALTVTGPSGAP